MFFNCLIIENVFNLNPYIMKTKVFYLTILCLILNSSILGAQTIWTGPTMTFTKPNFADWTLEENQDRITDIVWITRTDIQGIFNIFSESSYTEEFSPEDTEWAFGTTAEALSLSYDPWEEAIGTPPDMMNLDMVVHLITEDIYIDIKFTAWTGGGNGGGFTYERSTDQTLGINNLNQMEKLILHPNPATNHISITNFDSPLNYAIYNTIGTQVSNGKINNNEQIDIVNYKSGIYIIQFDNGISMKFVKI
jgi:hypothetical protein